MNGRDSMDTAPKDRVILLLCGDSIRDGRWNGRQWVRTNDDKEKVLNPKLWREMPSNTPGSALEGRKLSRQPTPKEFRKMYENVPQTEMIDSLEW